MRRSTRVIVGIIVGALILSAWSAAAVQAEEPTKTIQGEVVDPAAYLRDGKHGPELADQTSEAVNGGQSLAILEEGSGSLYLLLAEETGEDPNELVYDYANQKVKVTGKVYERGGLRGVVPTSIVPLVPQATNDQNATAAAPEH